jgi:nucleoside-diphosphate-sugar epimerase
VSTIFATGVTGTIGKHFDSRVTPLKIDLSGTSRSIKSFSFGEKNIVIHAGGIVGSNNVNKDIDYAYKVNVLGTRNLAIAALNSDISKFVFVSSSHVYAMSNHRLHENSKVAPLSEYARQKFQAENEVIRVFEEFPNKLCIVRVFSVLDWDTPEFTLGNSIFKLANGDPNAIILNADDTRDFLTPKSVAEALIEISYAKTLTGVVNLSSGRGTTIFKAAQTMVSMSGKHLNLDQIKKGNSINPYIVGSNKKLKSIIPKLNLSWNPTTFKPTKMIDFLKSNN